jgi:phosphoglycolate phosphatase (TIGR01487 family)
VDLRIRLVATDIDGTLTERRGSLILSLEAVSAIRELEENGIRVSLVSGNSIPIVAGLARYLGASGPSIGENGCVLFYRKEIIHLCEGSPSNTLLEKLRELGLQESWQNPFRFHDKAFLLGPSMNWDEILDKVSRLAEAEGMRVLWSGYAIHIQPPGGGKGRGVIEAGRILGIPPSMVAVVGDGENDLDMFVEGTFKACPADAAAIIKKASDYVASKPVGEGFAEIARLIIEKSMP